MCQVEVVVSAHDRHLVLYRLDVLTISPQLLHVLSRHSLLDTWHCRQSGVKHL